MDKDGRERDEGMGKEEYGRVVKKDCGRILGEPEGERDEKNERGGETERDR